MANNVKLFDKKLVHFMWDEHLVGKKGFFSNSIRELIVEVISNSGIKGIPLKESADFNLEFTSTDSLDWKFFYYDPLYDYKWSYRKGRKVQYRDGNIWRDVGSNWDWDTSFEYRVVVEEKDAECSIRLTWKQLAEWLVKGNGQAVSEHRHLVFSTISYEMKQEVCELPDGWQVRKWGDTEWHEPTMGYCFQDSTDTALDSRPPPVLD